MVHTKLNRLYEYIKRRCNKPQCKDYKNYGARGIRMCWESFEDFKNWAMNNGYEPGLEIDRIDNNGNYEPNNCRFVNHAVNNRNKRRRKDNTTGYTGVWYHKQINNYVFELCVDGKRYRKSGFNTAIEAYSAKLELVQKLGIEYGNE